ncbi:urease accessory protein UreE [Porcipelethomonas sp.]|uniref:urease accessory protein UreE n=1 Tax=Porcipelethomonas sp. TaxID=2981675 RepID=UPI003EF37252
MIAEKIYGKLGETEKAVDYVTIDWFEREKKILRKTTSSGEDIGIKTESALNEGDVIYEDENRVIAVEIAPCSLICVHVNSMQEMGRLCFELGNRHLSLSIGENTVKCPFDEPTFSYLNKLGFTAEKVFEKFNGYIECKAHAHTHSHGHHHE